jgi:hypothetical protein
VIVGGAGGIAQTFPHPDMPGMQLPLPAMPYHPSLLQSPLLTQTQNLHATPPADTDILSGEDSPPATADKRSSGRSTANASASHKDGPDKVTERRARRCASAVSRDTFWLPEG